MPWLRSLYLSSFALLLLVSDLLWWLFLIHVSFQEFHSTFPTKGILFAYAGFIILSALLYFLAFIITHHVIIIFVLFFIHFYRYLFAFLSSFVDFLNDSFKLSSLWHLINCYLSLCLHPSLVLSIITGFFTNTVWVSSATECLFSNISSRKLFIL
jgi:hypothetical protein